MVTPATVRAGPSIGPFAAQHGGNARIVSVLRFQLLLPCCSERKTQGYPQCQAHAEIPRRDAYGRPYGNSYRKTAIDHRDCSRA